MGSIMRKKTVVGITGKAGTGKDTVANYLVNEHGFKKDSFAAPLKRLVGDIFCVPDRILNPITEEDRLRREQPMDEWPQFTVRKLLQFIGTELFRNHVDRDVWVKSLCQRIMNDSHPLYVISDVRFPNELDVLKNIFGDDCIAICMVRNGCSGDTRGGISAHESEAYNLSCDYEIDNNGSFSELYEKIDGIIIPRLGKRQQQMFFA